MLIYKAGRLYAGHASFSLPDNCGVNDAPFATLPNGINLKSKDGVYLIDVNFEFGPGGAQRSLEDSMILGDFSNVRIKRRFYSEQTGWSAEYRGELYSYFEVRFDAPTGLTDYNSNEVNIFRVIVTAPRDTNFRTIRHLPEITELLNSFRP